jgi:hypothetical protein
MTSVAQRGQHNAIALDELARLIELRRRVPWTHEQWLKVLRLAHEANTQQEWQGMGGDKVAMVAQDGDESGW